MPFGERALPAWLHLPPGYTGGRLPTVVSIPGMDGFKERATSLYGDRWLNRGIAVLGIEGPGQYESAVLGIHVTVPAWVEAGRAIMEWLRTRPEVDPERIGVTATSFGSFAATIAVGAEPRFRACAVAATVYEPGFSHGVSLRLAHLQTALHVHGRLYGRGGVRPLQRIAVGARICKEHSRPVPRLDRRVR